MNNKRAGIVLDNWKAPTFRRILALNGFAFEEGKGVAPGTLTFYVETDDPTRLTRVVAECNIEAHRARLKRDQN